MGLINFLKSFKAVQNIKRIDLNLDQKGQGDFGDAFLYALSDCLS